MEQQPSSSDRKRIIVMGAGAVGQLLGCKLAQRGHAVSFLVRPGRSLESLAIRDLDHDIVETLEEPTTIASGDPTEAPDWLLLAVRGDQLDEALPLAQRYLGTHTVLVVVPPLLHKLVPRVRDAGIDHPTIPMLVGFGVWPVGTSTN
jgi:ketopantoate reductase